MNVDPYPHLSPELRRLTGDALLLWGDANARAWALLDIVAAWDRGDGGSLERAVPRLDGAVAAGLAALNLPRDPGAAVRLDRYGRGWIGRVTVDGTIHLDVDQVRHYVAEERHPDRIVHALVHESLERAGMRVLDPAYDYYVAAYRALADAARLNVEDLWRALWHVHPGQVRERFAATVDAARRRGDAPALDAGQLRRLAGMGDRVFAGDRFRDLVDERALTQRWELALQ